MVSRSRATWQRLLFSDRELRAMPEVIVPIWIGSQVERQEVRTAVSGSGNRRGRQEEVEQAARDA